MRYCNGGHNLPFVVKKNGTVVQVEDTPGIFLGKFESLKFETKGLQCSHGDRIVLYTDGVTEAMNEAQEMYLETRLLQYLETHRPDILDMLVRGVIVDVMKYMGRAIQSDDITVLSLEYRGKKE